MKDFRKIAEDVRRGAAELRGAAPGTMASFRELTKAAYTDGALDKKTKELIALALGVAAHCDGCIAYHAMRVAELGASREEVAETIGVAIHMGGGPASVVGAEALAAFDAFKVRVSA